MSLSEEARAFAASQRLGHLATADRSARPHVVPVCYALHGDCIYIVIDDKPKRDRHRLQRLRNLAVNPQAALVIDQYDEDWSRLAFLLIRGEAALVTDEHEYGAALETLRARYPQYRSMALAIATHPMIRLTPRRHHLWRARAPS